MNTAAGPGLYHPSFEHDSCGVGFVTQLKGVKSHQIVLDGLTMLERMHHRGASGAEANTGDGAGILIQIPDAFFARQCEALGFSLPKPLAYAVGLLFLPVDQDARNKCRARLEQEIAARGMILLGYRPVPVNDAGIGITARASQPLMEHVFIAAPEEATGPDEFERKLFILRKHTTHQVTKSIANVKEQFYFSSLSCQTISYKGMLTPRQLRHFFPDLEAPDLVSAVAVIHARFSTNTLPSWRLAQPFRYIGHNGEINTVQGNINWFNSKEAFFKSPYFTAEELQSIMPVCNPLQSDSSNLDNVIELLVHSGRPLAHVMSMLLPEAWEGNPRMEPHLRDFYEYHANLMEPWDGPAAIVFTDGNQVGATLDRNGLRPLRYVITKDDRVILASETGVLPVDPAGIVSKGRLKSGMMFLADLEQGRIIGDEELKHMICSRQPYGEWVRANKVRLSDLPEPGGSFHKYDPRTFLKRQLSVGYTTEDLSVVLKQMCETGKEAMGSMGSDIPLAVLSHQAQHLSSYFKQLFAQVTNPPIDPIRERMIMSLSTHVGGKLNLLEETAAHCVTLELPTPILSNSELEKVRYIDHRHLQTKTIYTYFRADGQPGSLERGIERVCSYVTDAIEDGFTIIILSDRSFDSGHAQIPSLLAVGAVHHHLIRNGLRGNVGILVESGDVWETHHFATLLGYGASGVNPYLVFQTIHDLKKGGILTAELSEEKAILNYRKAVCGELLKIMSKMGISTLQSYHGAQVFEALGISQEVVERYFYGTVSRIGGLHLDDIARETLIKHHLAFPQRPGVAPRLEVGGVYQWKLRGEKHLFNPQTIHLLQQATRTGSYPVFKKYSSLVDEQQVDSITLRSLLRFKRTKPVALGEVEPVENILRRFATGAMSFGSLSQEAHTTLAIAMNRIGGKSNCGEGGEEPDRFWTRANGDSANSAIKQVASGRFGVTSLYLASARELQIKMAQGAKPGEGGQLPGHKVDGLIARVRHATPGVGLISPPPHHDIYSIEDLAQLIFDLKNANRDARISVKLVSEAGVGTVASGVAKAHADVILISGHDGGTGASPLSSIRHAGLPWEMGLAEVHQTLIRNGLRGRVILQADGQVRTGRDLAVATLLGAEEWGVATAALVSAGCILMRKCHLNTGPVGVATQREDLRALFSGSPDHVANLFRFLAGELREIMAELGFRTVDEMVGRTDLLEAVSSTHWKAKHLDLRPLLEESTTPGFKKETQDHGIDGVLDRHLIRAATPYLVDGKPVAASFPITNEDRAVGTMLSHELTKRAIAGRLPGQRIDAVSNSGVHIRFKGTAGQSFGAFAANGLTLELEGDANDYFGKGLSGGRLVVYPDKSSTYTAAENIIVGNVVLYGATSGEALICGRAGERFAVRNSGATAVVEGVGDHGCEYMTGGLVIILGDVGRNFGAGMSGGTVFVQDPSRTLADNMNPEVGEPEPLDESDGHLLKRWLVEHHRCTASLKVMQLLANWPEPLTQFVKVVPAEYKLAIASAQNLNRAAEVVSIENPRS